jgi:hypothetical protein
MTERDIHPVANVFPLLVGDQFHGLVSDIMDRGLREPITLHPDGSILDGRNRYRACLMAKVEPQFVEWDGQGTPQQFVISKNLARRYMSESQRAMVAAKLADMPQGARSDLRPIGAMSTTDAAEALNVGKRSVTRAKAVRKSGNLKLVEAVEAGTMSVAAAELKTRPSPPVDRAAKLWLAWERADDPARRRFIKKLEQSGATKAGEAQLYAMQNQWLSANDRVRSRFGKWLEVSHELKLIKWAPPRRPQSREGS